MVIFYLDNVVANVASYSSSSSSYFFSLLVPSSFSLISTIDGIATYKGYNQKEAPDADLLTLSVATASVSASLRQREYTTLTHVFM